MTYHTNRNLGIWFADEIKNILVAVDKANQDVAKHVDTPEMALYRLGYRAAIEAIATAFGIAYGNKTQEATSRQLMQPASTCLPPSSSRR